MRALIAIVLLAQIAACGDAGADVDFDASDIGEDRFAVASRDGAVRMALTDGFVYFALSDSVLELARSEIDPDSGTAEGIRGAISGIVRGGVSRALSFRAKYPVDDIRDIRWEDGRMVFDFDDPRRSLSDNFKVEDRPVEEAFAEADVQAFAREFRRLKGARPTGGG